MGTRLATIPEAPPKWYLYYCTSCDDGYVRIEYTVFTGDSVCPNCHQLTRIERHGCADADGDLHLEVSSNYYERVGGGFHVDYWRQLVNIAEGRV